MQRKCLEKIVYTVHTVLNYQQLEAFDMFWVQETQVFKLDEKNSEWNLLIIATAFILFFIFWNTRVLDGTSLYTEILCNIKWINLLSNEIFTFFVLMRNLKI